MMKNNTIKDPVVTCTSLAPPGGNRGAGLETVQRDVAVLRNHGGDLAYHLPQGGAVVALAQPRHHVAPETAHLAVRKNGLESVADLGPVLVVADGHEDHYAPVRALVTHPPFLKQVIGEVLHGVAIQGLDGNHRDLGLGFLVDFGRELRYLRHGRGVKYAGEIVDVSLYVELLPLLSGRRRGEEDREEQQNNGHEGES